MIFHNFNQKILNVLGFVTLIFVILFFCGLGFAEALPTAKPELLAAKPLTGAKIDPPFSTLSQSVVVAVIDTGLDLSHPRLKKHLWVNPGEDGLDANGVSKRTNGIDDDKNGFVDDVHGWNFSGTNKDISDGHSHGTHISGIILSSYEKSNPSDWKLKNIKFMVLKYFEVGATPTQLLKSSTAAIHYARKMGADIINYSSGGPATHVSEYAAIAQTEAKDILFVAAAGNNGKNADAQGFYPASYSFKNILSVGAHNKKQRIIASSNYGKRNVDIVAHGHQVLSTIPGGGFARMTGTSQATAQVAGVAAGLKQQRPHMSSQQIIRHITNTGSFSTDLLDKVSSSRTLSPERAHVMFDASTTPTGIVIP